MKRTIVRECVECGKPLLIILDGKKIISGGEYFGDFKLGVGNWIAAKMLPDGSMVRVISRRRYAYNKLRDIVRLVFGLYERVEYWVCTDCYAEADNEMY